MNSKLSFAMDSIPRQRSLACLSLKFGCIISALIIILYSVLSLAQCLAAFNMLPDDPTPVDPMPDDPTPDDLGVDVAYSVLVMVTIAHVITFVLSAFMLLGVLREKSKLMKPWIVWTSLQVLVAALLFVFWSTVSIVNHSGGNSLLLYIIDFLGIMVRFYMLVIVTSYYKELVEEIDENARLWKLVNSDTWYSTA